MAAVIVANGQQDPVEEVKDPAPADVPKELEAQDAEPPKKKHTIDERLSKLAEQKREAQQLAEQLKKERDEIRAQLDAATKDQKKGQPPKVEDYTDAIKYAEALADWRYNEKLAERAAKDAADKASAEAQRVAADWQKKVKKAAKEIEDYAEVTEAAADMPISYQLRDAIVESDIGPQMHYFLAQNPEIVEEMNQMPVAKMHKYFGRLEAKLEREAEKQEEKEEITPVRKRIAAAPEPIVPVKGIGSVTASNVSSDGKVTNDKAFRKEMRKGLYGY